MSLRKLWVLAAFAPLAACASETHSSSPDHAVVDTEQSHRRLALSKKLVEEHHLTADDLSQLQLYVHGKIVLRREADSGQHEITPQHSLKIITGRAYDEVVIDSGTPGVPIPADALPPPPPEASPEAPTGPLFRVNFDPGDPSSGLLFEPDDDGVVRFKEERKPGDDKDTTAYGAVRYTVTEGRRAYLEIDAESLRNLALQSKKLPGNLLPPGDAPPTDSTAPSSSAVAPPSPLAPPPAPSN